MNDFSESEINPAFSKVYSKVEVKDITCTDKCLLDTEIFSENDQSSDHLKRLFRLAGVSSFIEFILSKNYADIKSHNVAVSEKLEKALSPSVEAIKIDPKDEYLKPLYLLEFDKLNNQYTLRDIFKFFNSGLNISSYAGIILEKGLKEDILVDKDFLYSINNVGNDNLIKIIKKTNKTSLENNLNDIKKKVITHELNFFGVSDLKVNDEYERARALELVGLIREKLTILGINTDLLEKMENESGELSCLSSFMKILNGNSPESEDNLANKCQEIIDFLEKESNS